MNKTFQFILLTLCGLGLVACAANKSTQNETKQDAPRKIYLTEDDYMEDLNQQAYKTRREAKPNTESQYLFELLPETEKNVYFFDERVRPMVPGEPSEREYKKEKRLHQKPKRYSPEQYYGNGGQTAEESTPEQSYGGNSSGNYDWDE